MCLSVGLVCKCIVMFPLVSSLSRNAISDLDLSDVNLIVGCKLLV